MRTARTASAEGFSLIEVIVSTAILTGGLLALAQVFTLGMHHASGSSPAIIAREQAREAVESVHTARDTGDLSWAKIRNVAQGGVFLAGAQSLKTPGVDGLVDTADDGPSLEMLRGPGPNGVIGDADDTLIPLTEYTREIRITDLMLDADPAVVDPNLRKITVIVQYKVDGGWRSYTLTTFVSSFK